MTRLKARVTGSTVPPWDVIVALLPVKSQHVTSITRVLNQTSNDKHIQGVLGTVSCGDYEFPCFIDADHFPDTDLSTLVGQSLTVTVVSHHPDERRLEFRP